MDGTGQYQAPRRSSGARVVLVVFLCVAAFGFLVMAAGFLLKINFGWTVGILFFLIGVVGAIISGIVWLAQPKTAQQIPPSVGWPGGAAAGWYPDPQNPAVLRWFDGRTWTSSTQPRQ